MTASTPPLHYTVSHSTSYSTCKVNSSTLEVFSSSRRDSSLLNGDSFIFNSVGSEVISILDQVSRIISIMCLEAPEDKEVLLKAKYNASKLLTMLPLYIVQLIDIENIYPTGHATLGIVFEQDNFGTLGIDIGKSGIAYFVNLRNEGFFTVAAKEFEINLLIKDISLLALKKLVSR